MDALALASEFPPQTRDAWRAAVARVLKGADPERRLVGRTADGLRIEPIYPKAEAAAAVPARGAAPWRVAARVDHPDAAAANGLALADLEGGADALTLVFGAAATARGFGLPADAGALGRALEGVMLDLITIRIEAGPLAKEAASFLAEVAARRGHDFGALDVDLGLDPIGTAAWSGSLPDGWAGDLADTFRHLAGQGFRDRVVLADGRPYHEAGASEAQELACMLATAVAYLRALEAGGHPLEAARDALSFVLVADADEFLSIAKLRALRRLWAQVEESCGLAPARSRLHAETSWRMTTRRDPWVNLLRGTLAAFSAGIGGADSVSVVPFSAALGLPDAFARRLARNTQLILLEESNLWRVADPVAGSGAFEALTDALADEAWTRFGEIEREGGIAASLTAGAVQGRIAAVRDGRATAVATRRAPLTGTSEFPDIREAPVAVLMRAPAAPEQAAGPPPAFDPLPSVRAAEPFERLRDRSDAILAATGRRPSVFLANLGPVAAYLPRTTFAKNAFEAGGIEATASEGVASHDELAELLRISGARVACLCSSDEIYATEAVAAAERLRAAGASRIYLAGRPGDDETELRRAGVTDFIYAGCDLPAAIGSLLEP